MAMRHSIFLINIPPDCEWAGCEFFLLRCFRQADTKTQQITLVTTRDIFSARFQEEKFKIQVKVLPFSLRGGFISRWWRMVLFLAELKPHSIVFVHNAFLQFLMSEFVAAFCICPWNVFTIEVLGAPKPPQKIHGYYQGIIPKLNLWWYKYMIPIMARGWLCRKILVMSQEMKQRLVEYYAYPFKRIVIVHNGADTKNNAPDPYVREKMRKKFNIPTDASIILSMARLSPQKGLHRAILAFDDICLQHHKCWLIFVGDGPLRQELESLAKAQNANCQILFLGSQKDPTNFYKMSDIFILPSDNEGMSTAMLEAMAAGLIAVVTRTPGSSEVIQNGINGFLVSTDEQGVREGLKTALSLTPPEREEISRKARRKIVEEFNENQKISESLNVIEIAAKKG